MIARVKWATGGHRVLVSAVLGALVVAGLLSVDIPRDIYGVKSDEATYVTAALSVAFDRDLVFEQRDLERFQRIYGRGPDGIFLKRGKHLSLAWDRHPPFVHPFQTPQLETPPLYFAKPVVYSIAAAPFVRVFGLNGLLVFHFVLLLIVGVTGFSFVRTRSGPAASAFWTTAFLSGSVLPVYFVLLMPEFFTFSLVFLAYHLWLYKEVLPDTAMRRPWTDATAAVLLGVASFTKPVPVGVMVLPLVLWAWSQRRWRHGLMVGALAVTVTGALFVATAAVSGEFNYQGGDRKVFYGRYPFDAPGAVWDQRGIPTSEPADDLRDVIASGDIRRVFVPNLGYFTWGRHFGLIPYFFPGVLAVVLWLRSSSARRDRWRALTMVGVFFSAVALLLVFPFSWSGGGGPTGNRYFLPVYGALFFLVPPVIRPIHGVIAWAGGALFVGPLLVNPFLGAKAPWQAVERGAVRTLPVELTMADDLPVFLIQPPRIRIPYGPPDDRLWLYFLDHNAWPPERHGMWIAGGRRADVIVRHAHPIDAFAVDIESPIATTVTVSAGGRSVTVTLSSGKAAQVAVTARGVRGRRSEAGEYFYLLSAESSSGFLPSAIDGFSRDDRLLGAQLRFRPLDVASPPRQHEDRSTPPMRHEKIQPQRE